MVALVVDAGARLATLADGDALEREAEAVRRLLSRALPAPAHADLLRELLWFVPRAAPAAARAPPEPARAPAAAAAAGAGGGGGGVALELAPFALVLGGQAEGAAARAARAEPTSATAASSSNRAAGTDGDGHARAPRSDGGALVGPGSLAPPPRPPLAMVVPAADAPRLLKGKGPALPPVHASSGAAIGIEQ